MVMIQTVVRPERVHLVMKALLEAGFPAVTKMDVFGRGKQRGLKVGEVTYDELPKEMLMLVVDDADKDLVVETILKAARTGERGAYGDGKVFVLPVEASYTVSSGKRDGAE
jgi:nitrogen regulatory protein PII 1